MGSGESEHCHNVQCRTVLERSYNYIPFVALWMGFLGVGAKQV
jgi:hypothetical protein